MDKTFFDFDKKLVQETMDIYQNQCAAIFDAGMIHDETILNMLAIGKKNNVSYLPLLADLFCRDRLVWYHKTKQENIAKGKAGTSLEVVRWAGEDNKHFNHIRNVASKEKADLIKSSINSYFKRVAPKLLLWYAAVYRRKHSQSFFFVLSLVTHGESEIAAKNQHVMFAAQSIGFIRWQHKRKRAVRFNLTSCSDIKKQNGMKSVIQLT